MKLKIKYKSKASYRKKHIYKQIININKRKFVTPTSVKGFLCPHGYHFYKKWQNN